MMTTGGLSMVYSGNSRRERHGEIFRRDMDRGVRYTAVFSDGRIKAYGISCMQLSKPRLIHEGQWIGKYIMLTGQSSVHISMLQG